MKILLDENVPVDLLPFLRSTCHTAESVNFIGWKGIKNGDLLMLAQADFDLFITRDKDFDATLLGRHVTPRFGIILLAIPQQRGQDYVAAFAALWPADAESLVGRTTLLPP
jgi:predicted nuclease of predicted toxin-antitoxin system